jgi:hypothetical protein
MAEFPSGHATAVEGMIPTNLFPSHTDPSRSEKNAPWESHSSCARFAEEVEELKMLLPTNLTLAKKRYTMHLPDVAAPYQLIHTIFLFCTIMLHREYVPYIPLKCSKPEGPKDAPKIDADAPPGWWENSAALLFKSARDLVELMKTAREADTLVETPLIGFALYTAAFTGKPHSTRTTRLF